MGQHPRRGRSSSVSDEGVIEWFTSTGVAVYSAHPRTWRIVEAVPGLVRWQVGSTETRYLAPVETLPALAGVLGLRRRRALAPEDARRISGLPTVRRSSRPQDCADTPGPEGGLGGRPCSPP